MEVRKDDRLESKTQKTTVAKEQSLKRRKEQWKGLDSFDRLNKGGFVTGFPSGALIVRLFFDQSEKVCHLTGNSS